MGTRRRIATIALVLVAIAALAATAGAEVVQTGVVRVSFKASVSPTALPRETPAPITVSFAGQISTTDGSQPPALQRLQIGLNSAGVIDSHGLPLCSSGVLQSTSSEAALEHCRSSLVGSGHFEAQVRLGGEPIPVAGRSLVFNGEVGGRAGMLIHIYIARPVRLTLVIPLKISRGSGEFGTVLTTVVPKLAGGTGAITELSLKIGRRFNFDGARHSYLSAACPAPPGFHGGPFTLARGSFSFVGGSTLRAKLVRHCEVRNAASSG
jgi:hypothetical protein